MTGQTRKQQIESMLEADPSDAFLRYALAMECVSAGDDPTALDHFSKLLDEHPDYIAGYFQRGQALVRLDRLDEARHCLAQGIAAARKTGDLHAAEEMNALLSTILEG
jgi:tetratricopeptide (TPR) repeat protein